MGQFFIRVQYLAAKLRGCTISASAEADSASKKTTPVRHAEYPVGSAAGIGHAVCFISKILLGVFVAVVLPLMVFFYRESVVSTPRVADVVPPHVSSITTTTPVSTSETKPPLKRESTPMSQVVKTKATETPIATTTKPSPSKQTISTPGALVVVATTTGTAGSSAKENTLDVSAIIALTNVERAGAGLAPLAHSGALSSAAQAKALDMIVKQYFAHVAPDGTDIAALAEKYGYAYLNIGENLALGDFHSSSDVVNGWMNSLGHRANILNREFTEIGVAAIEGNWKGERVWFAVQEFGRPASACPAPDLALKNRIATSQTTLASLDVTLKDLQVDIDAAAGDQAALLQKTNDYNVIVNSYNSLVADTKSDIAAYNSEVQAFNTCAGF
jgi:uncharacterized protein YkwD